MNKSEKQYNFVFFYYKILYIEIKVQQFFFYDSRY